MVPPEQRIENLPIARPVGLAQGRRRFSEPERMHRFTRVSLVVIALGLCVIFGIAAYLHPYDPDGTPRSMATHTQLGMPPCNMIALTGKPCPSCGMTTSFSLLVHGDVRNSLRANWVGTLLALVWMSLIPWGIGSAIRGKPLGIRSIEGPLTLLVGVFFTLMLARWGAVLLF